MKVKVTLRQQLLDELKALGEAEEALEDEIRFKLIELKNLKALIKKTEDEAAAYEEISEKMDRIFKEL